MLLPKDNSICLIYHSLVTICVKAKQKEWEENVDNILPEMGARTGVNLLCALLPGFLCFLRLIDFCFHSFQSSDLLTDHFKDIKGEIPSGCQKQHF